MREKIRFTITTNDKNNFFSYGLLHAMERKIVTSRDYDIKYITLKTEDYFSNARNTKKIEIIILDSHSQNLKSMVPHILDNSCIFRNESLENSCSVIYREIQKLNDNNRAFYCNKNARFTGSYLTTIERSVAWALSHGMSQAEIADMHKLSNKTISHYSRAIMKKFLVKNKIEFSYALLANKKLLENMATIRLYLD